MGSPNLYVKKKKQVRQKHAPMRTCVVCRQKHDKRLLTRIVRSAENGVVIDPSGKQNGRGAYLCAGLTCWRNAIERNVLNSALKVELSSAEKDTILAAAPQS